MNAKNFTSLFSCLVFSSSLYAATQVVTPQTVSTSPNSSHQINLNTADAKALSRSIKGIGLKRAEAMIKYREAHNGFHSIDDLAQVPGLGKNFVKTHREELQRIFTTD